MNRCQAALDFPRAHIQCAREEGHRGRHEGEGDGLTAAWTNDGTDSTTIRKEETDHVQ